MGAEAVIVEADGVYAGGMGKEPVEGYALSGLVAKIGNDIITIKMVGPKEEVEAEKAQLIEYAKTLKPNE
jgi:hypothetical protein